ncbi:MAG: hypothetical protein DI595_00180 [Agrobacterium fabrum]|uniref:Uncharacterized protein n=1 Tax=Agrobacterium fabrum TaxID=1176649 RepID=A0A2W5FKL9_9HYPH|nr:MAG: hypothetical protein DI595_00180 [Agrobacterium fabrum]
MAMLAALAVIASACSPADPKPAPPIIVRTVKATVPPASRVPCVVGDLPDRDLSVREVTARWGADRTEIMSCDARRAAAVAAIDNVPETTQ